MIFYISKFLSSLLINWNLNNNKLYKYNIYNKIYKKYNSCTYPLKTDIFKFCRWLSLFLVFQNLLSLVCSVFHDSRRSDVPERGHIIEQHTDSLFQG